MAFFSVCSSRCAFTNWFGHKRVLQVVENRFQLGRARGLVDLIVDGLQLAGGQLGLVVAAVGVHLQRRRSSFAAATVLQLVFRQREYHRDGMQLGNDQHRACCPAAVT